MTRFVDLTGTPVLGRLRGVNRKYRLRAKHYQAIGDWPETAAFDVLDAGALAERDHFASSDALFVVSDKLKAVLAAAAPDARFFAADARGKRVWVAPPPEQGDVTYETGGEHATYAKGGYQVVAAKGVHVKEAPKAPWCRVRNLPLVAIRDDVIEAAAQAGVAWRPLEEIADYRPFREHPYVVVSARGSSASADKLEAVEPMPEVGTVPHPLGTWVRDEKLDGDPDVAWNDEVHENDVERAVIARYCSGLPLPKLRASLDAKIAKSKMRKRWKEASTASAMSCAGMFAIAPSIKDVLGPSCRFTAIELVDPATEEKREFWIVEPPVVAWMDWERCDVAYLWSAMYDGFYGLHPTEESYTATQPIVRVEGTSLILVHRDVAGKLGDVYVKPVHEMSYGLNLDDYVRAR